MYYVADNLQALQRIPDASVDTIITSPPFNKKGHSRSLTGKAPSSAPSCTPGSWVHAIPYLNHDDNMDEDKYIAWQTALLKECRRVLKPGGLLFYHHTNRHVQFESHFIDRIFKPAGLKVFDVIYWDQGTSVQQATDRPTPVIEPIYLLTRDNSTAPRYNTRAVYEQFRTTRWSINKARSNFHPCVFPALLVEMCILLNSKEGDVILDPHAGSGSVLLAAHNLKRRYLGFDISEGYQKAFLQQMQA